MTDNTNAAMASMLGLSVVSPVIGVKDGTLIGRAYSQLKSDIIHGRHPPHSKLRVEHLKAEYGVSGGTLREALTLLIADRLVVAEGQRGFRVRAISVEELIDLNRIRILLEKEAIRLSVEHGDMEWEASVVSSFHMLSKATDALAADRQNREVLDYWESTHRAFHLTLIAACPSEWLRYFLELSYQQYERYKHLFLEVAKEFYKDRDAHKEHAGIVDAIVARDGPLAARLVEEHVTRSIDEWVGYFEQMGLLEAATPTSKPTKAAKGAR